MSAANENGLTQLLMGARQGDSASAGLLVDRLWDELHGIAGRMMNSQPPGHTLQATALVNEAYLRLIASDELTAADRSHFLAIAARAMRQILATHARDRRALKRGGEWGRVSFSFDMHVDEARDERLALDRALEKLAALDSRQAQVVEMRFFAGMTIEEMAQVLAVSASTVEREWRMARAWIRAELSEEPA